MFGFDPTSYTVAEEAGFVTVSVALLEGGVGLDSDSAVVLTLSTVDESPSNTSATGNNSSVTVIQNSI